MGTSKWEYIKTGLVEGIASMLYKVLASRTVVIEAEQRFLL